MNLNTGQYLDMCSETYQRKIKFVLTFTKNDQTLVEIFTVVLYFGLDVCWDLYMSNPQMLKNVSCQTVISCSGRVF